MRDEEFAGAQDALAAIEADRARLRRRVRAASWWYYPGLSSLIALSVASPALERAGSGVSGFWISIAALGGIATLTGLQRWQVGVATRLSFDAGSVVVVVSMVVVVFGLFVTSLVAERFALEQLVEPFPVIAFAVALLGCILLDRLGALGPRRAR